MFNTARVGDFAHPREFMCLTLKGFGLHACRVVVCTYEYFY